jgi:hypothetical protein
MNCHSPDFKGHEESKGGKEWARRDERDNDGARVGGHVGQHRQKTLTRPGG